MIKLCWYIILKSWNYISNLNSSKIILKWRLLGPALLHHFELYPTLWNFSYKLLQLKFMKMDKWKWALSSQLLMTLMLHFGIIKCFHWLYDYNDMLIQILYFSILASSFNFVFEEFSGYKISSRLFKSLIILSTYYVDVHKWRLINWSLRTFKSALTINQPN